MDSLLPCTPPQEEEQGGGLGAGSWSRTEALGTFILGFAG